MKLGGLRVLPGVPLRLKDHDPAFTGLFTSKKEARNRLLKGIGRMRGLQEKLYAQDRWAVLIIFQALDAAGKDSTIAHVMSGLNPQGCQVYSFKAPTPEELNHDFLWRTTRCLPERGRIGVFNRSYYEEVLVPRVHPEVLMAAGLPPSLMKRKRIWDERFEDINALERHLTRNGTVILKFFLHVSKEEQRRRFLERLQDPHKNWKFSPSDLRERGFYDQYMEAYQEALRATSTEEAPWYVVPADHKWFTRLAVADVIVSALESLRLRYPKVSADQRKDLEAGRVHLEQEG